MKISALRISGTALQAERARMEAVSQNMANAETTRGPDGKAYRRKVVIFQTIPEAEKGGGGVKVLRTVESSEGMQRVHNPGHPDADAQGYVEMPNVNIIEEMVDMIAASRAYEANVGAANATKGMINKALELGR
jgi:flagellar basal-body rod protein FlgC